MKDISKKYENLYFANFLLLCIISSNTDNLINLKIKATESYVSEINYINVTILFNYYIRKIFLIL